MAGTLAAASLPLCRGGGGSAAVPVRRTLHHATSAAGAAPRRQPRQQPLRRQQQQRVRAAAADLDALIRGTVPPLQPAQQELSGDALAAAVESAFGDTFWGALAAPRVLASFRRLQTGDDFVRQWPGLGLQHASSYVEGLSAVPFPDPHGGAYPWLEAVEASAGIIQAEFAAVTADAAALAAQGTNVWVPAARGDALAYGPEWRTLVLQDRGHWEPTNSRLFPQTAKIIRDLNAPTLEVFFARQTGGTGIKSHTDFVNFIQTSHLGLDVPEGDCWIKVGDFTKRWENGKAIVCDTSFMHETQNGTSADRIVLIMRHWHPEVSPLEQRAIQFLFDCLDNPTPGGIKAAQRAAEAGLAAAGVVAGAGRLGKKGGKKKKGAGGGGKSGSGGKGFGPPVAAA